MRLPDATQQVKAAPIRALRALFSGIGQLLLAADRFRAEGEAELDQYGPENHDPLRPWANHQPKGGQAATLQPAFTHGAAPGMDSGQEERHARPRRTPGAAGKHAKGRARSEKAGPGAPRGNKQHQAGQPQLRSLDSTNNVRLLTPEDLAELTREATQASQPHPGPAPLPDLVPSGSEPPALPSVTAPVPPAQRPEPPIPGYENFSVASIRARLRTLDAAMLRSLLDYERSTANRAELITMFERRIAKLESGADAG